MCTDSVIRCISLGDVDTHFNSPLRALLVSGVRKKGRKSCDLPETYVLASVSVHEVLLSNSNIDALPHQILQVQQSSRVSCCAKFKIMRYLVVSLYSFYTSS